MRGNRLRYSLLAAGFAALAVWRVVVARAYPVEVPFAIWAIALILFGAALFRPWHIPRPNAFSLLVAAVIAAALVPRFVGSEFDPYEVTLDEAIHPLLGHEILASEPWRIFDGVADHFATPYVDLVLQALLPGLRGARWMSAILSAISLWATYGLARRLYDRETALFATIVLACAYWHIAFARTGYPFMQTMAIVPLALWALAVGLQEDRDFPLFVGGLLLGLSALVYTPGRIVVPIFALWWTLGALLRRFRARSILPVALGLIAFLSPYLYRHHYSIFLSRFRGTSAAATTPLGAAAEQGWLSESFLNAFAAQVKTAARIYADGGGWMAPHSGAPGPMIDQVTLALAVAGLVLCLVRLNRSASLLLLIWVAAVFFGGQVFTDVPQSAYRAAPLLPALAIAAGAVLATLAALLGRAAGGRREIGRLLTGVAALACLVPANLAFLDLFHEARIDDPTAAMARVVGNGDPKRRYFVVDIYPNVYGPRFKILVGDNPVRDVDSLSDLLGPQLAEEIGPRSRGAVIILGPLLRAAEQSVRRCYPGAIPLTIPHWRGSRTPAAFWLRPQAIANGADCALTLRDERGLRATYYAGESFDGEVVRRRIEDWPMRWLPPEKRDFGSVEWRGFLNVPVEGTYKMHLMATSVGSAAQIGNALVLKPGETLPVRLSARPYPVTLRLRAEPNAQFGLFWIPPGGDTEAVPPSVLSPYHRNRSDNRWMEEEIPQ